MSQVSQPDYLRPLHTELGGFSLFFSNILKVSSLPQIILHKRAEEELVACVEQGLLTRREAAQVLLSPQSISNAKTRGNATFNQIIIWCRVLWKWHHSREYRELCQQYDRPQADFGEEHVKSLLVLAGYVSSSAELERATAFADAFNAAADLVEMSPIRSALGGRETSRSLPAVVVRRHSTDELPALHPIDFPELTH